MHLLESTFITILAAAFVLGILILVHEWGHFVVAKLCGVRVNVFSFGYGPRLLGWKRGDTDYRLSALPFGGYVRMAGDNPSEDRSGSPDEFLSRPRWQRFLIAIAGPSMNFILAIVVMGILFLVGVAEPTFMGQQMNVAGVLDGSPAAEAGIKAAERAIALKADTAEYHRVLGTLCGQAISANVLAGMKYGHCAQDSVNKALQLDPKSAINFVSRGVGNYYLPPALGGGLELAIKDFQKAIELDPQSADAHLWLGLALRKTNRNAEARKAFQKAIELNPARVWAKQQLDKTPAQ